MGFAPADVIGKHISMEGYTDLSAAIDRLSSEKRLGLAVNKFWFHEAKTRIQPYLRKKMKHRLGGSGKLAKSYTVAVMGKTTKTVRMDTYSRVDVTVPHEYGGRITPKKGKYLSIPTKNAQSTVGGKRGRVRGLFNTRKRLTARMLIQAGKKGKTELVTRRVRGKLILFQKVAKQNKKLRKYFMRAKRGGQVSGLIPMFIFVKSVFLRPRTNVRGSMAQEVPRIARATGAVIDTLWGKA